MKKIELREWHIWIWLLPALGSGWIASFWDAETATYIALLVFLLCVLAMYLTGVAYERQRKPNYSTDDDDIDADPGRDRYDFDGDA